MFEQLDATLPEIIAPVPVGTAFQMTILPRFYLKSTPPGVKNLTIRFANASISADVDVMDPQNEIQDSMIGGVKMISADFCVQLSQLSLRMQGGVASEA